VNAEEVTGERRPDRVVEIEYGEGDTWLVGLGSCGRDQWHALYAQHVGGPEPDDEAFEASIVAHSVLWVQDGDDEATRDTPAPGDVAATWPDTLTPDAWQELADAATQLSSPEGFEWAQIRIRRSPLLALEMAVAHEYRVTRSELLSWPSDDRAYALAFHVEQKDRCPGCGVPSRAMLKYEAAFLRLRGCVHCEEREEQMKEANPGQHLTVELEPGV
jgi:hypothetical protein